jgi:hypothetical protein
MTSKKEIRHQVFSFRGFFYGGLAFRLWRLIFSGIGGRIYKITGGRSDSAFFS